MSDGEHQLEGCAGYDTTASYLTRDEDHHWEEITPRGITECSTTANGSNIEGSTDRAEKTDGSKEGCLLLVQGWLQNQ